MFYVMFYVDSEEASGKVFCSLNAFQNAFFIIPVLKFSTNRKTSTK